MGRHIKEGLSYFPMDVDFFEDEKVQFISARFGVKGDGILIRVLCKIYRQGYYIKFDDDVALLLARSVGDISLHGLVRDVVNESLKRDFFDEGIFKKFQILTSKGIQKRYTKICTDSKRKGWEIEKKFDLLRMESGFTPEEIEESQEESTQSKVKKSKVKESKEYSDADAPTHSQEEIEMFKKFQEWIEKNTPKVARMKEPFTIKQYLKLKKKLSKDQVQTLLFSMHNRADLLKKNDVAYLTILNWSKRDSGKERTEQGSDVNDSINNKILNSIKKVPEVQS